MYIINIFLPIPLGLLACSSSRIVLEPGSTILSVRTFRLISLGCRNRLEKPSWSLAGVIVIICVGEIFTGKRRKEIGCHQQLLQLQL